MTELTTDELLATVRGADKAAAEALVVIRGGTAQMPVDHWRKIVTSGIAAKAALDTLAARLEAAERDWQMYVHEVKDEQARAEAAEREVERLREALEELATCVMHGWTDPAFVRGKLHTRAVEIARAALGKSE
jgi:hypothetical protein